MVAAYDMMSLMVAKFVLSFVTRCLWWDLALNCVSCLAFFLKIRYRNESNGRESLNLPRVIDPIFDMAFPELYIRSVWIFLCFMFLRVLPRACIQ